MMDYDKLIERLSKYSEPVIAYKLDADFAAAVVEAKDELQSVKYGRCVGCSVPATTVEQNRDIQDAPKLRKEIETLRAENETLRKMKPMELSGEAVTSFALSQEVSRLRAELERVKAMGGKKSGARECRLYVAPECWNTDLTVDDGRQEPAAKMPHWEQLMHEVKTVAGWELERGDEMHPKLASAHEGYAALLEEVEETKEEIEDLTRLAHVLWCRIRTDGEMGELPDRIYQCAVKAAAEAVQVAAVARKFRRDMLTW